MIRSAKEPLTYPGVKFFLLFAGGIYLGDALRFPLAWILAVTAALILLAVLAEFLPAAGRFRLLRLTAVGLAAVGLGFTLEHFALSEIDASAVPYASVSEQRDMRAVVTSQPELLPHGYTCELRLVETTTDGDSTVGVKSGASFVFTRAVGTPRSTASPVRGDTLVIHGWLNVPRTETAPDGFNYRNFLNRKGITVTIRAYGMEAVTVIPSQGFSLWQPVHDFRMHVYDMVERYAPHRKGIIIALLLGDKGYLESDVRDLFRAAGIVHVLAVSGLHTGIILLMFYVLFLRFPLKYRIPLVIAGLVLYAMATGLAPPVLRASIIAIVFLIGRALQRNTPPVNAIAVAGVAVLLFDPQALFTLSFQLSFIAAFSIALFFKPIDGFLRKWEVTDRIAILRYGRGLIAVTLAAQIGTLPVILSVFGSVSIVSIITNLFAVPLAFFIVTVSFAGLLIGTVVPTLGGLLLTASGAAAEVLVAATAPLAHLPFAELHIGQPPWWLWVVYGTALLYLAFGRASIRTRLVFLALSAVLSVSTVWILSSLESPAKEFEIAFLDVGQGDATLITTPDGGTMLIDAGPNYRNTDAGRRVILPYLRMRGIDHLDALVLTHADTDHIGGAETVLAGIDVDTVYYSGIANFKSATRDLDSVIANRNIPVRQVFAGDRIPVSDDARFYVLAPFRKAFPEEADNDGSIVILAVYGKTSALFMGDADIRTEHELIVHFAPMLPINVLKAGHHGSKNSTGKDFMSSVEAQFAVVSCGRNNRYGHPARRVTALLEDLGITALRTDRDGTVILSSDGTEFKRIFWNK